MEELMVVEDGFNAVEATKCGEDRPRSQSN